PPPVADVARRSGERDETGRGEGDSEHDDGPARARDAATHELAERECERRGGERTDGRGHTPAAARREERAGSESRRALRDELHRDAPEQADRQADAPGTP